MLILLLISVVFAWAMAGICPPPGEISPCRCCDLGSKGFVVQPNCAHSNVDDDTASQILNKLISWSRVSPIRADWISLSTALLVFLLNCHNFRCSATSI